MTKYEVIFEQFHRAVKNLDAILKMEKTDVVRDAAIKRFELAFDLCWKCLKAHLELQGIKCASPRECFEEAYRAKLLEYNVWWVTLVSVRNYTVHTYKEIFAEKVYQSLPEAALHFQTLLAALENKKI